PTLSHRHCEERSDEAIQTAAAETVWIASLSLAMTSLNSTRGNAPVQESLRLRRPLRAPRRHRADGAVDLYVLVRRRHGQVPGGHLFGGATLVPARLCGAAAVVAADLDAAAPVPAAGAAAPAAVSRRAL